MTTSVRVRMPTRKAREPGRPAGRFLLWGIFFGFFFYFRYRADAGFARSTRNDTRTNETILRVRKITIIIKKKSLRKPIIFTRRGVVRRNTPRSARRKRSEKKRDLRKGLYCANKQFLRLRRKDYAFFVRGYRVFLLRSPPHPFPSRSVTLLLRLRGRPTIVINNASARIAEIKKTKSKINTNSPFVPDWNR